MKRLISLLCLLLLTACSAPTVVPGQSSLQVRMQDNRFAPMLWRVNAAETVAITLTNQDAVAHRWALAGKPFTPQPASATPVPVLWQIEVPAGETVTAHFTAPPAAGEYDIVCPEHFDQGMRAVLVVVQP